jgi:hypothetical protein
MSFRESVSFGRITFKYPTTLATYTLATVPSPTDPINKFGYITITDGGTGNTPILAYCNGTNWVAVAAAMTTVIV